MPQLFADNVKSTLSVQLLSNATSLRVADFAKFPVLTTDDYFKLVITMGLDYEIVKVTGSDSGQSLFYIERAQDGSTAKTWPAGETTVFIGPVAADAALAARWQFGYPIYNVPINGQLKKFHCNVLTGSASTYTWPDSPLLGDVLEIINHTSSTAVRTIGGVFSLDQRTLFPTKLLCENIGSWVFRASRLSELLGLSYSNLNDRPASLLPNKPTTAVNTGALFVYPDNQSLRITGTGTYTLFPPVNTNGSVAKSFILYIDSGAGGTITDSTSSRVITINQKAPNGILFTANADGSWDIPYIRTSDYAPYSPIENFPPVPYIDGEVVPGIEYQLRQQDTTNWGTWWPSGDDVEEVIDNTAPGWTQYFLRFKRISDYNSLVVKQDFFEVTLMRGSVATTNSYTRTWIESTATWTLWSKVNVTWKTFEELYTFISDMALTFMTKDNPVGKGRMILEGPETGGYASIQLQNTTTGPVANINGSNGGLVVTNVANTPLVVIDSNGVQSSGQITMGNLRRRMGELNQATLATTNTNWVTLFQVLPTSMPWYIEGILSVPAQHWAAKVKFGGTVNGGILGPYFEIELLGASSYWGYYPAAFRVRRGAANTAAALDFRFVGTTSNPNAIVQFDYTSCFIGQNAFPHITVPFAWEGSSNTSLSGIFQMSNSGAFNFKKLSWTAGSAVGNIVSGGGNVSTLAPITNGGVGPT